VTTDATGQGTYTDLTLSGPAGSYSLVFSSAGLQGVVAGPIQLSAGAPAGITLTTQPSTSAKNDEAFQIQPVVTVTDGAGNPVPGVTVTASIATAPPPALPPISTPSLGGTVSVTTNASGVAGFTDLEIVGPIGDYTLGFAAGGLSVPSATVTLQFGVETQLVITQQPTNVALFAAISPAPTVELRDSGNNRVPVDGRSVTVSIASGNGAFLIPPLSTLTVLTSSGVAVFSNIRFEDDGPGNGNHTLQFSSPGLPPSAPSSQFKVN
jgi:hypothetical protein